jgi:signal transduction histidine kinase
MAERVSGRSRDQPGGAPPELDALIASVLHRLRTPLTAIKGWNELALRRAHQQPDRELEACLTRVRDAVIVMQRAIDEIAAEGQARRDASGASDGLSALGDRREEVSRPAPRNLGDNRAG